MKNNWIKWVLGAILVLLFIFGCSYAIKSCKNKKFEDRISTQVGDSLKSEIKLWRDKFGAEHISLKQSEADKYLLQSNLDKAQEQLGIKSKQVENLTDVTLSLKAKLKLKVDSQKIVYVKDTNGNSKEQNATFFSFEDLPWISVHGDVGFTDTLTVQATDSLRKVDFWTRNWFLGPKTHYTDISHVNTKYISIPNVQNVSIRRKDPSIIIAPSISTGWNPVNWNWNQPSVRVGVSVIYYPLSIRVR